MIPRVFFASAGQVMYVVLTFVPTISRTKDCRLRRGVIDQKTELDMDCYLNVLIRDSLDVSIPDFLVPDLEWLGANAVQN